MRNLRYMALACATAACAAFAFGAAGGSSAFALTGKSPTRPVVSPGSYQVAEAPVCHFVNYTRKSSAGTPEWCFRCVKGYYDATRWTTCPVRQGPEGPGFVRCEEPKFGYGSVRTEQMCDYTSGGGSPAPTGATIRVTSATYGASCRQPAGNVTRFLSAACDGRATCDYSVNWRVLGDPAVGCRKDFSVQWTCGSSRGSASAPAEDHLHKIQRSLSPRCAAQERICECQDQVQDRRPARTLQGLALGLPCITFPPQGGGEC